MHRMGMEEGTDGQAGGRDTGFIFPTRPVGPIEIEMPIQGHSGDGPAKQSLIFRPGFLSSGRFPPLSLFLLSFPLSFAHTLPLLRTVTVRIIKGKKKEGGGRRRRWAGRFGSCDNSREWTRGKEERERIGRKERMEIFFCAATTLGSPLYSRSLPTSLCGFCFRTDRPG